MRNLEGKRLLLLGGGLWKEAIYEYARKNKICLVATGNSSNSGIFKIADETYLVDSTDSENMKKLIKDKKIDGVYMGGAEPVISAACQYINELNMPCYCTKKQWDYLQNKVEFKKLCLKFGLPVVPQYDLDENTLYTLPDEAYPVITKPSDGCGSSGFSFCPDYEALKCGYEKAKNSSPSGSVIIEKFAKNDAVVVFYTFSNGKMYFSGLEDKYPVHYENEGTYVAGLVTFESRWTDEFRDLFEDKIENMMQAIGIKEGSLWIEVFHDCGKYYFNEVGFRYGGTATMYAVDYFYHINQVASDIYYALTGESCIKGHLSLIPDNTPKKKHYGIYMIYLDEGKITKISGVEDILSLENVVVMPASYGVGDTIYQTGSFFQVYARVQIVYDTPEELSSTVDYVHEHLKVLDEHGNNMVHRMLDLSAVDM